MGCNQLGTACLERLGSNFEFLVLLLRFSFCFYLCPVVYKVEPLPSPNKRFLLGDKVWWGNGVKDARKEVT